ncbi:uncharacterized protein LOC131994736 [Stomoxys calcitrans]|uniref:uncharacterized protein LOC131994736 n=3 Tax=Stomoxys calcitrans TaxID=35570 RepID=UPI0027E221DA|nr:uncharacterized protein LOC131994736 [Stomoxys calcitrans]
MAARRKFLFDLDQLITFCSKFESQKPETFTVQLLEIKDLELERRWSQLVSSYETLVLEDEKEVHDYNDQYGVKFEEASCMYQKCKEGTMILICAKSQKALSVELPPQQHVPSLKLPPCDTPLFEGGYSQWPAFRDIFSAVFGKHPSLSPAQKLYHLRGKTRGEAYDIVKKFELTDANFNLAWEALINRYENRRILVNQQMKKLFSIQFAQNENPKSIRQILSSITDSLAIFRSYGIAVENWDPILIHIASSKIPDNTLRAWEDSLDDHKELPSWSQMEKFLSKRIEKLETIIDFRKPNSRETYNSKANSFQVSETENQTKPLCKTCNQYHSLMVCQNFKSLAPQDRIQYAMENKLCLNCLSQKHFKPNCTSRRSCSICNKKHHTMLHLESKSTNSLDTSQNYETIDTTSQDVPTTSRQSNENSFLNTTIANYEINTLFSQNEGTTILPTARIHLEHGGELFTVRALLDTGSEKSFIAKRIQQKLMIPLEKHNSQISGLGGTIVSSCKGKCLLTLKSTYSDFRIQVKALVVSSLAHFLPSRPIRSTLIQQVQHLSLADPFFYKQAPIEMIIGSDYLPFINKTGMTVQIGNGIEARESQFGWYLSGPTESEYIKTFSTLATASDNAALQEQLKRFWELEEVGKPKPTSDADIWCENFYKSTTYRDQEGRYVVRLPFIQEFPDEKFLGSSRHMAFAQYCRMEKHLSKNQELKYEYDKVLREYIALEHMVPAKPKEEKSPKVHNYFLPHHAVIRPESKSTKVRVVFNASKKTTSGLSLNDVLHAGPILQQDLMKVLLNWRYYRYVFNGDIQKMYRQIWIHEDDQQYQQILFRTFEDKAVEVFRLKTVTFGVNAAPFLAIRTLLELSKDCKNLYPKASNILQNEIYVDDVLSGAHSLEEAKVKQEQLVRSLSSAGFSLKKLTANNKILLESWPREDLLSEEFLNIEDQSSIKTLGVRWNAMADFFYYTVEPIEIDQFTSKRKILSTIAKLFDPLGWLGPTIVIAKMLMQDLWEERLEWDESVPAPILQRWSSFVENLQHVSDIQIKRWIQFSPQASIQIHGFSDASEKAYCAAVYIRVVHPDGDIYSNLLVSKTKVAPLKRTTIPKLELCGADLLTKLIKSISNDVQIEHKLFLWTDSSIVLGWLQKSPQTLKTFVANRISDILSVVDISQWNYVKTDENPADLGSRGCAPLDLSTCQLWWHGPSWLSQPHQHWPKPRTFEPTDLEAKRVCSYHTSENAEEIISRFSSFNRCLRVICYIFRFYQSSKRKETFSSTLLRHDEIDFVKRRLIHLSQKVAFPRELEALCEKKPISKKSKILAINPVIDDTGLLRVGGRLTNCGLSYEEIHPIILPEKSKLAELMIKFTHRILLHAEHHTMLRAIRQGFYIPRVKNIIRQCIRNCKPCTIVKHRFQNQIMASLPPERVQFSLPFTFTGVDFAGPFNIRASKVRNSKTLKGYAAVFVCFSTKAVHLETCSELSSEAFIATFSRFTGRRGLPKTIFSDNGRNFVGASYKLLKEHHEFLKSAEQSLVEKYATHGFNWSFIPPYAPHMGGLWEAAVKSMKTHLKKVAASHTLTFEELTTLLIMVESILNSRPLSPISGNPNELNPLTPGHFLRGAPIIVEPSQNIAQDNISLLNRWERLKALQQIFARRWKTEYITELQRRIKWKTTKNNIKINDFVVIKDELLPPTDWRLGRVTKVHYGSDNNVRVAEILTQSGTITRPIVKLCVLPTQNTTPTE